MSLPNTYTTTNETNCCPVPNYQAWDKQRLNFENQNFIRLFTKSLFHLPLNMAKVMKKLDQTAEVAGAKLPAEQAVVLSRDLTTWKAEQLYSVNRPVEGADNITINSEIITMVFEGAYSKAKDWHMQMQYYATSLGKEAKEVYLFYTTCPKCAKHYGKNYVIGIATI